MEKIITKQLKVLDLFSGCGGLALGFQEAGFYIHAGMELNDVAANTASYNLHWKMGIENEHLCIDIKTANFNDFMQGAENPIVIGGPPCQAYSLAGRAKLNSLGEDRRAFKDSRGYLFEDFLRAALVVDAKAVIMENVLESVNYNGINVPERVCEVLEKRGYEAYWTLLNSADYGVPQIRERVFVIAIKKEFVKKIEMPIPTHQKPDYYVKTINEARIPKLKENKHFKEPNKPNQSNPNWVTVGEAISDLPALFPTADCVYKLYKPFINLDS